MEKLECLHAILAEFGIKHKIGALFGLGELLEDPSYVEVSEVPVHLECGVLPDIVFGQDSEVFCSIFGDSDVSSDSGSMEMADSGMSQLPSQFHTQLTSQVSQSQGMSQLPTQMTPGSQNPGNWQSNQTRDFQLESLGLAAFLLNGPVGVYRAPTHLTEDVEVRTENASQGQNGGNPELEFHFTQFTVSQSVPNELEYQAKSPNEVSRDFATEMRNGLPTELQNDLPNDLLPELRLLAGLSRFRGQPNEATPLLQSQSNLLGQRESHSLTQILGSLQVPVQSPPHLPPHLSTQMEFSQVHQLSVQSPVQLPVPLSQIPEPHLPTQAPAQLPPQLSAQSQCSSHLTTYLPPHLPGLSHTPTHLPTHRTQLPNEFHSQIPTQPSHPSPSPSQSHLPELGQSHSPGLGHINTPSQWPKLHSDSEILTSEFDTEAADRILTSDCPPMCEQA